MAKKKPLQMAKIIPKKRKTKYTFKNWKISWPYFIWIIGIIISAVPILFKCLKLYDSSVSFDFWNNFFGDTDFIWGDACSILLVFFELYLIENQHSKSLQNASKIFGIFLVLIAIGLMITYTILYFTDKLKIFSITNIGLLGIVFVLGTIFHILISIDEIKKE